jgi:hypothetical protein
VLAKIPCARVVDRRKIRSLSAPGSPWPGPLRIPCFLARSLPCDGLGIMTRRSFRDRSDTAVASRCADDSWFFEPPAAEEAASGLGQGILRVGQSAPMRQAFDALVCLDPTNPRHVLYVAKKVVASAYSKAGQAPKWTPEFGRVLLERFDAEHASYYAEHGRRPSNNIRIFERLKRKFPQDYVLKPSSLRVRFYDALRRNPAAVRAKFSQQALGRGLT